MDKENLVNLLNAIPFGAENAIHMEPLAKKLGVSARRLRRMIREARMHDYLIGSGNEGYFQTDEQSEESMNDLQRFYNARRMAGTGTLRMLRATKKKLEELAEGGDD